MFKSVRKKSVRDQNAPESVESYYSTKHQPFIDIIQFRKDVKVYDEQTTIQLFIT